ncbi:unnamed protein product [Clonostachys solani]|uniref:Uncharacterized protein n=1 Tax=Clonostachys solani TaxID=160281 RepID=A0A9N9YPL7_9HYPO|nr:unnamed protein product [Clonostachys solani]
MAACSDSWLGLAGWTPHWFRRAHLGAMRKTNGMHAWPGAANPGHGFSTFRVGYDGFRLEDRVDIADMDIGTGLVICHKRLMPSGVRLISHGAK